MIGKALAPPGPTTVHLSDRKLAPDSIRASAVSVLPVSDQPATRMAPPSRSTAAEWTATAPRAWSLSWSAGRTALAHTAPSGKPGAAAKRAGPPVAGSGISQARSPAMTNSLPSSVRVTVPSRAWPWRSPARGALAGSSGSMRTSAGPSPFCGRAPNGSIWACT